MKRHGYLYEKIISIENLKEADRKAQRGKKKQFGVKKHNKNREQNILKLHEMLKKNRNQQSIASYLGWLKYGNCRNLRRKLNI